MTRLTSRVASTVCTAVALFSFTQPAQAQQDRTKLLRFEAGYSRNHDGSDNFIGGAVRVGLSRAGDRYRYEAGVITGVPYLGLDVGVEMRASPEAKVGPLARAGGGLLLEDGFTGPFVRAGGGVEVRLSPRAAFRATAQAGYHGGAMGPHSVYVGLDYRW
jgi:hypothetical protein